MYTERVLDGILSKKLVKSETLVRELSYRKVFRLTLTIDQLPAVYLKCYVVPFSQIYKAFLWLPGLREWEVAQKLQTRGISTYCPIAFGVEKKWGIPKRSYLLTEEIPRSRSLKSFIEIGRALDVPFHKRIKAVKALAAFIQKLHQSGVIHRDLHWGNILMQGDSLQPVSFYLIDLHQVRIKAFLTLTERLRNLALFNVSFYTRVPPKEQIRFLYHYFKEYNPARRLFCSLRYSVEQETKRLLMLLWHRRDKRCSYENKYFLRVNTGGLKGFAAKGHSFSSLNEVIENPDALFRNKNTIIVKDSRTTSSLVFSPDGQGRGIYVKRYNWRGLLYSIKNLFLKSRAEKAWQSANSLRIRDISTPRPLLYLERRKWGFLVKAYFITEKLCGASTLQWFIDNRFPKLGMDQKRVIIRSIALAVRKMHDRGICHGDLKANNILISQQSNGIVHANFVDLDAAAVKDGLALAEKIRDLGRLNCSFLNTAVVSKSTRLAFLKYYLGRAKKQVVKRSWRDIVLWTEGKLKKSGKVFFFNTLPHGKAGHSL